jgi:hypothetical protein
MTFCHCKPLTMSLIELGYGSSLHPPHYYLTHSLTALYHPLTSYSPIGQQLPACTPLPHLLIRTYFSSYLHSLTHLVSEQNSERVCERHFRAPSQSNPPTFYRVLNLVPILLHFNLYRIKVIYTNIIKYS